MGTAKDNMSPSVPSKDSSLFGQVTKKFNRKAPASQPQTFVDQVEAAHDSLTKLIATKESDFKSEKGGEMSNATKVATLKSMMYHLEQIMDLAVGYSDVP